MFDERHLQLTSAYARASQHFIRAFIYPLGEFIYKSIESAIDLKCRIEIGEETYFLTPDEDGGWKWSKLEREVVDAEFVELEELLEDLLPPLLPGNNTTPPDFPPNDSPPLIPTPNSPLNLPPSAMSLEFMAIPLERQNAPFNEQNNYQPLEGKQDTRDSTPFHNNSFYLDEIAEEVAQEVEPLSKLEPHEQSSSLLDQATFTTPFSTSVTRVCPQHIDLNHWQELIQGSAIAPSIAELNFKSLKVDPIEQEHEAWEYLMYSDKIERINLGRLNSEMLRTYSHIEHGGWWCSSGVDPRSFADLKQGEQPLQKPWGCYKPNQPREKSDKQKNSKDFFKFLQNSETPQKPTKQIDKPKKFIKYEHPPKTGTSIFLLDVPTDIEQRIYSKAGVNPSQSDRSSGFWYCVWKHNVPITITEGAKKAACLLSQGEAAIGVPGIYNGYRKDDEFGNPTVALHPELAVFATKDRHIKICFDYETKAKTKRNINIATYRTGQLLEAAGSKVSVVQLPGPHKGVDDLIVAQGADAFFKVFTASVPLDEWWQNNTPPDLRLVVFLKNGQELRLYEQKGDGTVTTTPENITEQPIDEFLKLPSSKSPTHLLVPSTPIIDAEFVDIDIVEGETPATPQTLLTTTNTMEQTGSWSRKQEVTLYQQNFFRKSLEARENQQIASAAYSLLKKYGIELKDTTDGQANGKTYQADAFIIKGHGDKFSISRRHNEQQLMTFQADRWGHVGNIKLSYVDEEEKFQPNSKKQISILPIERQEFLLVADYLKSGKLLPSVDEDPRKIASTLSSLSPKGTHNILESFKEKEVLKILTQTITSFGQDDLTLGNYRILFQQSTDNTSTLQLLKTEHNGITREAVRFELERTETGMTHQVKALAITEADLEKLRLLAQKLHINYQSLFGNPTYTRDIDLPLHPEIARNFNEEQSYQSTESTPNVPNRKTQSNPQAASSNSPKQHNAVSRPTTPTPQTTTPSQQNYSSNLDKVLLPLHPVLKQYWEQLVLDTSWNEIVEQGHLEFQSQIQQTQALTIGEQRELYQLIQNLAWSQINHNGRTDIVLPPLAHIVNDLRSLCVQQPQPQISSDPKRDTLMPLHPDIASYWHDLETNKTWSSVANQYNNPLRQKLTTTGKLTIGEQRELYQKILLQSLVEQHNKGQTNISLPPLSDVVQDLMNARSQIINNTYTPKVEVHSQHQKSHTPQQPATNSQELEF